MTMCRINYDHIYISLHKRINTCKHICCDTNRSTTEKSSLCILGCKRILDLFLDILDGNESF